MGQEQLARPVRALGQHVELDHVDPGSHRGIEAGRGVARSYEVGSLVTHAAQRWPRRRGGQL